MNSVWNLDPIYRGFEDPALAADFQSLEQKVREMEELTGKLAGMEALEGLHLGIRLQEDCAALIGKLAGYASLRQSADTKDPAAGSQMGRILALYSGIAAPAAAFQQWACSLPGPL